ncbi:unnamed protein product [Bursaphelenchus xylophilus]|uniref:(pine wood nematode) hypothetical protein n=1 Tax=Bursaphelenchus xylophilus TaxID=6326 RepID=A0A1I7RXK2_BURXY|nr:unnamed protein product [Bursaphelenchus xylophilus]CAG9126508.1 unnamed protein product [Bursaphelenchus xylophilus]
MLIQRVFYLLLPLFVHKVLAKGGMGGGGRGFSGARGGGGRGGMGGVSAGGRFYGGGSGFVFMSLASRQLALEKCVKEAINEAKNVTLMKEEAKNLTYSEAKEQCESEQQSEIVGSWFAFVFCTIFGIVGIVMSISFFFVEYDPDLDVRYLHILCFKFYVPDDKKGYNCCGRRYRPNNEGVEMEERLQDGQKNRENVYHAS